MSRQICQECCPWNGDKFVRLTKEPGYLPRSSRALSTAGKGQGQGTDSRAGFLRNVAVALGNWGSPEAVPALVRALQDSEPLVRGHAAWALGRIGTPEARARLSSRLSEETEALVREEIELALVA